MNDNASDNTSHSMDLTKMRNDAAIAGLNNRLFDHDTNSQVNDHMLYAMGQELIKLVLLAPSVLERPDLIAVWMKEAYRMGFDRGCIACSVHGVMVKRYLQQQQQEPT